MSEQKNKVAKTKPKAVKSKNNSLDNDQKREWAFLLYKQGGMDQKEIAATVGVTPKTIGEWKERYKWETHAASILITKEEEIKRLYRQLVEINNHILTKPEGQRYADSKQADTLSKLSTTIRNLETETNLSQVIEVAKDFIQFVREVDLPQAKSITALFDQFIKRKLK